MEKYTKILVVDDENDSRDTFQMLLESQGYRVSTAASASEAEKMIEEELYHVILTDIMMPGEDGITLLKKLKEKNPDLGEVIMITGYGSVETAVEAMRLGAFGYFIKSHDPEELLLEIQKAAEKWDSRNVRTLKDMSASEALYTSKNPRMQEVWRLAEAVADSNANVLITGESGTGKEIIARLIHRLSPRAEKPFIAINCSQYPRELIESELFGHEKGAFTGAVTRHAGKLEQAAGGTVFLDEIGDMSAEIQVKLLRVLETREVERLGGGKPLAVDFRLITATNKDLEADIRQGNFRQDFFYRINTIEINIPPLRERREDLPELIDFFAARYASETGKAICGIDPATRKFLLEHDYVGNVRELKNIIERMAILSGPDGILTLDAWYPQEKKAISAGEAESMTYRQAKQRFEREYLSDALAAHEGNITRTAQDIGMSRRQLFNKISELGLSAETDKQSSADDK